MQGESYRLSFGFSRYIKPTHGNIGTDAKKRNRIAREAHSKAMRRNGACILRQQNPTASDEQATVRECAALCKSI